MFYDRLQKLCKERGKKLTPLLSELGMSSSATGRWQDGTLPNGETLMKLANYFNVSTDYLLGNTDDPTLPNKKGEKKDDDSDGDTDLVIIHRLHKKLSPVDKEKFMKLLRIQFAEDFPDEDNDDGVQK